MSEPDDEVREIDAWALRTSRARRVKLGPRKIGIGEIKAIATYCAVGIWPDVCMTQLPEIFKNGSKYCVAIIAEDNIDQHNAKETTHPSHQTPDKRD